MSSSNIFDAIKLYGNACADQAIALDLYAKLKGSESESRMMTNLEESNANLAIAKLELVKIKLPKGMLLYDCDKCKEFLDPI